MPDWFGRLPRAACEVARMLPHEEKHSTIAYYREPAIDGSRPGRYYINTWQPATRPRYEAEALAFHEAVPGHHLQAAIAQELTGLPAFRRHAYTTAYVEGWGLYAERLADEMGLYSGDLDRLGMLSYDSWRACRLVVDTGMHALGWSIPQAVEFMVAHSALARNNIVNEVDRYLGRPGQALAYKIGQLEIVRLRSESQARLGAAFDVRTFHDAVLGHGPLPLETLAGSVEAELGRLVVRVRVAHEVPHPRVVRRQEGLVGQQREIGAEVGVEHHAELVDRAALVVEADAGRVDARQPHGVQDPELLLDLARAGVQPLEATFVGAEGRRERALVGLQDDDRIGLARIVRHQVVDGLQHALVGELQLLHVVDPAPNGGWRCSRSPGSCRRR